MYGNMLIDLVMFILLSHSMAWKNPWNAIQTLSTCSKVSTAFITGLVLATTINPVFAEAISSPAPSSTIIYRSGKAPDGRVPITSESKKDITFLRCMSNCKSVCQRPSEGRAKLDCVQDCQDQCCNSYEQCSFKIKTTGIGTGL